MFIVDRALEQREQSGKPIRVALIGAGFMGLGIADKIITDTPGMRLAAVYNRTLEKAAQAYTQCGKTATIAKNQTELEDLIAKNKPVISDDAMMIVQANNIDAIIEATGDVEFSARIITEAIRHGKHVVLMNAELDATLGPLLKRQADAAGVVYTMCEGDEPGAHLNLYRQIRGMGLIPVFHGNLKGLQDPYRNPDTQREFAERTGQRAHMVTSFADGSKMSFELTCVANATGLTIQQRGLVGYPMAGRHVDELTKELDAEKLIALGGVVDYALQAAPGKGVFCLAHNPNPRQEHYLRYLKMGDGPLYSFYTPFHLCHLEVPTSVARAVLFHDAVGAPIGTPQLDVIAVAKRDLKAGETIDGIGYFKTYGQCETYTTARTQNLLPMGLAEGCRLLRDLPKDQAISYNDVQLPTGRLSDKLRQELETTFRVEVNA